MPYCQLFVSLEPGTASLSLARIAVATLGALALPCIVSAPLPRRRCCVAVKTLCNSALGRGLLWHSAWDTSGVRSQHLGWGVGLPARLRSSRFVHFIAHRQLSQG